MELKHNILNRDEAIYHEKELQKATKVIKKLFKDRDYKKRTSDQSIVNLASHIRQLRQNRQLQSELKLEIKRKDKQKYLILNDINEITEALKCARMEFNEKIREERNQNQQRNIIQKRYETQFVVEKYPLLGSGKKGYTHTKPGNFFEMKSLKKIREIKNPKQPKTNENHIGVEIEFASFLSENQIAKLFYEENLLDYLQLQHEFVEGRDKANGENEFELCVVASEKEIEDVLIRVCRVLNEKVDANVTYGCGLHVHIDARNRDIKKMFNNLYNSQEILYSMVAHSRRSNKHVKIMTKKQWYPGIGGFQHTKECKETKCVCVFRNKEDFKNKAFRYYGLNTWSYVSHKTMEVRIHSGTSNPIKILNWIKLITKIVDGKELTKYISDVDVFLQTVVLDDSLKKYITKRVENFKVDENERRL